jgi:hypothetical protein
MAVLWMDDVLSMPLVGIAFFLFGARASEEKIEKYMRIDSWVMAILTVPVYFFLNAMSRRRPSRKIPRR